MRTERSQPSVTSVLFTPGRIGILEVKNRIVMPPMVRNYADEKGLVTPRYEAHVRSIAQGGVGMMILEASFVSPEGRGFPKGLGLHEDGVIPGLARLAEIAHKYGAVIGPQAFHAGRQRSASITAEEPVAPSAIPDSPKQKPPRELTSQEIGTLVEAYARGARRAKQAGFDFVELHGAHGYLINQFLSPASNKRRDEYGGSFENRIRFLLQIVSAVKQSVGSDFPVAVRIPGDELVDGGLTTEEGIAIAKQLEAAGVDCVHVSVGIRSSRMFRPMAVPDGALIPLARRIKRAISIPVIAVGKIRYPELAAAVIQNGDADFVAIGRSLLADPNWPKKVMSGRVAEINHCIACNEGCISRLIAQQDVWCTINPRCGREEEFERAPTGMHRKIFVAGGGPAGMEAAKVARERGDDVVLFEESGRLGGQLFAASATPFRDGWEELRRYLVEEISRLKIEVRLGVALTREIVERERPYAVVVATGSYQTIAQVPVDAHAYTMTARDLLEGRAKAKGRVVVAGGGCSGAQTAELLAQQGHHVAIVEQLAEIALDTPADDRALLLERLNGLGVNFLTNTQIVSVDSTGVNTTGVNGAGHVTADTIVFCLGAHPNSSLAGELFDFPNIRVVGDAVSARKVTEAMAEGAAAALEL